MSDYKEMVRWYANAESDAERNARFLGQSEQYSARSAAYYRGHVSGFVDIEIRNSRLVIVDRRTVRLKEWENRPRGKQSEIAWAIGG